MYPIHIRSLFPVNIIKCDTIIEDFLFLISKMAKSVPLTGRLSIECPDIIVDDARWFLINILVKELAAEERCLLSVQGPVEGDSLSDG